MLRIILILIFLSSTGNCSEEYIFPSSTDDNDYIETKIKDPYEKINRKIFIINKYIEKSLLRPVAAIYMTILPKKLQKAVSNILDNLALPIDIINGILIGKFDDSFNNFWRFSINTSFGIGGIYDFANKAGIKYTQYNFSNTLRFYNIPKGPYLVLPVIGPSNLRNTVGTIGDSFIDPFSYIIKRRFLNLRTGLIIVDSYKDKIIYLDDIENTSIDPYTTIRSLYIQNNKD